MKNIKTLFTVSFVLASVTIATACDLFTFSNDESNDAKKNSVVPANRPSTNHFERNANAKLIAKQLSKSASANAILGKTSDVLERYGYQSSENGTFFSNSNLGAAGSQTESFAIISIVRNQKSDVIRLKVESNKDLRVYLMTDSGLEIPSDLMNLGENEVFISSSHTLLNGNYTVKIKSKTIEKRLKFIVEQGELLGKN